MDPSTLRLIRGEISKTLDRLIGRKSVTGRFTRMHAPELNPDGLSPPFLINSSEMLDMSLGAGLLVDSSDSLDVDAAYLGGLFLPLAGGTMAGAIDLDANDLNNVADLNEKVGTGIRLVATTTGISFFGSVLSNADITMGSGFDIEMSDEDINDCANLRVTNIHAHFSSRIELQDDLDLNTNDIVGANSATVTNSVTAGSVLSNAFTSQLSGAAPLTAGAAVTGNVTVTGTVDGRDVSADGDTLDLIAPLLDAAFIETIDIDVVEDTGSVVLQLQASGGGDLVIRFGGASYTLDCTPAAEVTLTAGTDISPTQNYVYVTESGGTLTLAASTTGWPSGAHAPVATVVVQSAASLATDGAYKVHAWTDHISKDSENGHLAHLNKKLRSLPATWESGCAAGDISSDQIDVDEGVVFQLHTHTMPAISMSGGDPLYVVNDPDAAYTKTTDLGPDVDKLSDGTAIGNNKYVVLVLWGVVSEKIADCKIMLNLPSGQYNNLADAQKDIDGTADYQMPSVYTGCGFLIAKYVTQYSTAGGGSHTQQEKTDLRGLVPSTSPGGGSITDHDQLAGLADDDHTQYLLVDGTRATTGALTVGGAVIATSMTTALSTQVDFTNGLKTNGSDIDTEDGDVDIGAGDIITATGTGFTGTKRSSLNPGFHTLHTGDGGAYMTPVTAFVAAPAKDTYITGAAPTTNYGTAIAMTFGDIVAGAVVFRGLMEFDISAVLGTGLTLSAAYLRVYQTSPTGSFSANVYKCKRTFIEAQATWNVYATASNWGTAGAANTTSDIDTTISDPITITTASGAFVEYTVTNNAANALSGAGIMRIRLSAANEAASNNVSWNTKENTDGSGYRIPLLILIFTT